MVGRDSTSVNNSRVRRLKLPTLVSLHNLGGCRFSWAYGRPGELPGPWTRVQTGVRSPQSHVRACEHLRALDSEAPTPLLLLRITPLADGVRDQRNETLCR